MVMITSTVIKAIALVVVAMVTVMAAAVAACEDDYDDGIIKKY